MHWTTRKTPLVSLSRPSVTKCRDEALREDKRLGVGCLLEAPGVREKAAFNPVSAACSACLEARAILSAAFNARSFEFWYSTNGGLEHFKWGYSERVQIAPEHIHGTDLAGRWARRATSVASALSMTSIQPVRDFAL